MAQANKPEAGAREGNGPHGCARAWPAMRRAYRALLEALAPVLRAMAKNGLARAGAGNADAEDVVQEILLAIHLKRQTWMSDQPFTPWLNAIARHKLIDVLAPPRAARRSADRGFDRSIARLQPKNPKQAPTNFRGWWIVSTANPMRWCARSRSMAPACAMRRRNSA